MSNPSNNDRLAIRDGECGRLALTAVLFIVPAKGRKERGTVAKTGIVDYINVPSQGVYKNRYKSAGIWYAASHHPVGRRADVHAWVDAVLHSR